MKGITVPPDQVADFQEAVAALVKLAKQRGLAQVWRTISSGTSSQSSKTSWATLDLHRDDHHHRLFYWTAVMMIVPGIAGR